MDMMGRVGLVEIPILIAPDQKVWMDRMIKEGKIAIPPGGTLEKGSLYSMFVRMLLHNAMEEQKRQEVTREDEDDENQDVESHRQLSFSHRARFQRARARRSLALRCGLAGRRF